MPSQAIHKGEPFGLSVEWYQDRREEYQITYMGHPIFWNDIDKLMTRNKYIELIDFMNALFSSFMMGSG